MTSNPFENKNKPSTFEKKSINFSGAKKAVPEKKPMNAF